MTCGIYKLYFDDPNKVYIGQSRNIEKRVKQHLATLKSSTSNYKLREAYILYGEPSHSIILECDETELDSLEDAAISVWNSVEKGYNIYSSSNQAPTYTGFGSGNSKYRKDQIISVFNLLVDTDKTYAEIQTITDVDAAMIYKISNSDSHNWLKKEFPDKYIILQAKSGNRINYARVSDKLSAKSKGKIYPAIKAPDGTIYYIDNAYKFAKDRHLAPNHFQEVLNGHRKSHKGWKLCPVDHQ